MGESVTPNFNAETGADEDPAILILKFIAGKGINGGYLTDDIPLCCGFDEKAREALLFSMEQEGLLKKKSVVCGYITISGFTMSARGEELLAQATGGDYHLDNARIAVEILSRALQNNDTPFLPEVTHVSTDRLNIIVANLVQSGYLSKGSVQMGFFSISGVRANNRTEPAYNQSLAALDAYQSRRNQQGRVYEAC